MKPYKLPILSRSERKFVRRQRAKLLWKLRRYNRLLFEQGVIRAENDYSALDWEYMRLDLALAADREIRDERVARQGESELPF